MKTTALLAALALASAPALLPSVAHAAHAGAPYKNVNKANDAGNNTGDAETDKLNAAQLSQPGMVPAASMAPAAGMKDAGMKDMGETSGMKGKGHMRHMRHMHHMKEMPKAS